MSKITLSKPVLLYLYGYPGAGKTHFARQFCERVNAAHVHSDRIRYELFEEPRFDSQENKIVEQITNYIGGEFMDASLSVVYDMNAATLAERRRLRDMARKENVQPVLIWFQVDADTAFNRSTKRDKRRADDKYSASLDRNTFKSIASRMRNPERTEDYIVISGKHTFDTQFSAVIRKLYEQGLVKQDEASKKIVKPGMVNLVPNLQAGRVNNSRRNIFIR